jgi:hypothetical protein
VSRTPKEQATASDSEEESAPRITLRRSARANKGQRVVEQLFDESPKRKSKKQKEAEERVRLKAERAEKRRLRKLKREAREAKVAKKVG